jgi:hypothetical protein
MSFTMFLKYFRDCYACCLLDFLIAIEKRQADSGGKSFANRSLASAHKSNQHDALRRAHWSMFGVEWHRKIGLSH